jgi:hypothetical protein
VSDDSSDIVPSFNVVEVIDQEIEKNTSEKSERIGSAFFLAAIGAIPWVGGFLAAAAAIPNSEKAIEKDELREKWLEEHKEKIEKLRKTLEMVMKRFESFGKEVEERIQSPEYLSLVRQSFRVWDEAETEEKRHYVANLVTNCAGTRLCSDDVIRLFVSWLSLFHEAHFAVIREIYENQGSTRFDIWTQLYGVVPREDSAEADLYKMLIRDLSMGGVIRQPRDINEAGQFVRKRAPHRRGMTSTTMKSAFDDKEQYILTELGKQFVHYTITEAVTRIGGEQGKF